jgi:thymidylate synthase
MINVQADNATGLFTTACAKILAEGTAVAPRGLVTREVVGASLLLTNPRARLVDAPPARVLNPAFAVAETLWIISGSDHEWIHDFNSKLASFTGTGVPDGAYGPRLRRWGGAVDQIDRVRELLLKDPDSRRGTVQIFDPARDLPESRDVPCTLGHRFYIRGGRLHMHTTMRSQDAWLGLPYDVFAATVLMELMAGWVEAGLGTHHRQVDSLHLYQEREREADALTGAAPANPVMEPLAVPWTDFDALVRQVIAGEPVASPGWDDLAAVMAAYRSWKAGDRDGARQRATSAGGVMAQALLRWFDRLGQRTLAGSGR